MASEPVVHAEPVCVKFETAGRMLDCGRSMIWKLKKAGELEAVKVGTDDRITVDSIRAYVNRQVTARRK